jgi:glycosyltransferase involved in cell wall biosynthesis
VSRDGGKLRVACLLAELSSYLLACCRELVERDGAELLLVHLPVNVDAPFTLDLSWITTRRDRSTLSNEELASFVAEFHADVLFVAGWSDGGYRKIAKLSKKAGTPVVVGFDTHWKGTIRQRAASLLSPLWLRDIADVLWVTGERQAQLANRLGYSGSRCWTGVYCCDWKIFSEPADHSTPHSCLYEGRYVEEKGVRDLLAAYSLYRTRSRDPWPLYCAGTGQLRDLVTNSAGVTDLGFIQPSQLPLTIRKYAGALLLPSRFEPWGVVLQEAGACRRPVICSDACGAAPHLAHHLFNALRFAPADSQELATCMTEFADLSDQRRAEMGQSGFQLASQFTPERWARTLVEGIETLSREAHHSRM